LLAAKPGTSRILTAGRTHEEEFIGWRMTRNREDAKTSSAEPPKSVPSFEKKFEGESLFSTWLTRIASTSTYVVAQEARIA